MGVDLLRDVDAARSHRVRVVQSSRDEHTEAAVREATGNRVLEGAELPDQLQDQADSTQAGETRQPEPAVRGQRSDTVAEEEQGARSAQKRQISQ